MFVLCDIISESKQGNHYFSVLHDHLLYGFFCIKEDDEHIEIGLGMKPEYTGIHHTAPPGSSGRGIRLDLTLTAYRKISK